MRSPPALPAIQHEIFSKKRKNLLTLTLRHSVSWSQHGGGMTMMTVHEVSGLAGVSVRTLHHYDAIGLLPPTALSEAGYRLYDDTALARLQTILLFRELEFPLRDIKKILDAPQFDPTAALADQLRLLELRHQRLERLIALARETMKEGVTSMRFDAFDKSEQERFAAEVREKWGGTAAYQEYQQREKTDAAGDSAALLAQFAALGRLKALDPAALEAQDAVRALQQCITRHYYTCTPEILVGLGKLYVADERFRRSIDRAGGEGTAAFTAEAIRICCEK